VQHLEPPDSHYFSAAIGWFELGNRSEARAELAQISVTQQIHPDVLELRWAICAEEQNWAEGLEAARALVQSAPKRCSGWLHQAYALRRVAGGGLKQAWEALLPAFEQFPKDELIAYNLACYACQMEQLDAARVWLKRAFQLGKKEKIRSRALQDPDLASLWAEIREW
jgi:Flp pilus assembly protein TadD